MLLKDGNLIVKSEDDERFDVYDEAKLVNTMPSHFGSYILSLSKRLMDEVFVQIGGFFIISIYYGDTDSVYIHNKYWSNLVDNGFIGKSFG